MQHVSGENKGTITLYALSTCGWCKMAREFLDELGVEYYYVYVDLLKDEERESAVEEVKRWNPRCSFPTIVIDNEVGIVGVDRQRIKEKLGL